MNARWKRLDEIDDYEDFSGYAIDVEGSLWSLKYKVPKLRKPVWAGSGECRYLTIKVRDDNGKAKTLYLHKMVALAFLPCDDPSRRVKHKNEDRSDNRLENIEWVANKEDKEESLNYILKQSLVERMMQVHIAAQRKGLKTGNTYEFIQSMVEDAVEDYIRRYGLRKLM